MILIVFEYKLIEKEYVELENTSEGIEQGPQE